MNKVKFYFYYLRGFKTLIKSWFEPRVSRGISDRYQDQYIWEKLFRSRHYLTALFYVGDIDGDPRITASILLGMAQGKMKWYYDFEDVEKRLREKYGLKKEEL
jgi:hypothetical protein